ncbi:MAG: hypothetical protein KGJ62_08175 [Armatimonadetes bacterium]|nr:hypothetical protein [Armatimonadota bacterium]MDE2205253.1 hypothetical protein [Armatimonadota bacterium]
MESHNDWHSTAAAGKHATPARDSANQQGTGSEYCADFRLVVGTDDEAAYDLPAVADREP